jgi:membrane complex biogenesis BtpA family protein
VKGNRSVSRGAEVEDRQDFISRLRERRHLIGVVHLEPLPGSPRWRGSMDAVARKALADATAYAEGGVDALLVENFGDVPYRRDRVEPCVVAAMAAIVARIKSGIGLPTGVNVLRNDALAALGIAVATGAEFVRVNVLCGACMTDQGIVQGVADDLLRARRALGQPVAILADVRVKHAAPLVERDLALEAQELRDRGLADALVVTGAATGRFPDDDTVRRVAQGAQGRPVLVGSGVTAEAIVRVLPMVRGAIVATWAKTAGKVDPERVRAVAEALLKE